MHDEVSFSVHVGFHQKNVQSALTHEVGDQDTVCSQELTRCARVALKRFVYWLKKKSNKCNSENVWFGV